MKRTYIKPESELLDSELSVILCVSNGTDRGLGGDPADGENAYQDGQSDIPEGPGGHGEGL